LQKTPNEGHLQKQVPHSEYAKIEWDRRMYDKKWFEKTFGIIILGMVITVISSLILYLLLGQN